MQSDQATGLINQMLWASMMVAAPVLILVLIVGLAVSVLQATTQLQEITLSYVPKLFVAAMALVAMGPWMLRHVTAYAVSVISIIPQLN